MTRLEVPNIEKTLSQGDPSLGLLLTQVFRGRLDCDVLVGFLLVCKTWLSTRSVELATRSSVSNILHVSWVGYSRFDPWSFVPEHAPASRF